jgi:hypothetical protein
MVLALAGLSTTTTFFKLARETLLVGEVRRKDGTRKVGVRRPLCQRAVKLGQMRYHAGDSGIDPNASARTPETATQ